MKATYEEVHKAIDAIPEVKHAFEEGKKAATFRKKMREVLQSMGWTESEYIAAGMDRMSPTQPVCEACELEKLADWMMLNHTCQPK